MNVFTFQAIHYVLKAEKLLKNAAIQIKLIPTPREYSSDCGVSISLEKQNKQKAKKIIEEAQIICSIY